MMARLAVPDTTDDRQLYSDFSIYPNPADGSQPRLTVSGYSAIPETVKTRVEIINMTGEVVFTETISCGGDCLDYLISINEQLVPGVYLVNLKTKGTTHLQRLLVR